MCSTGDQSENHGEQDEEQTHVEHLPETHSVQGSIVLSTILNNFGFRETDEHLSNGRRTVLHSGFVRISTADGQDQLSSGNRKGEAIDVSVNHLFGRNAFQVDESSSTIDSQHDRSRKTRGELIRLILTESTHLFGLFIHQSDEQHQVSSHTRRFVGGTECENVWQPLSNDGPFRFGNAQIIRRAQMGKGIHRFLMLTQLNHVDSLIGHRWMTIEGLDQRKEWTRERKDSIGRYIRFANGEWIDVDRSVEQMEISSSSSRLGWWLFLSRHGTIHHRSHVVPLIVSLTFGQINIDIKSSGVSLSSPDSIRYWSGVVKSASSTARFSPPASSPNLKREREKISRVNVLIIESLQTLIKTRTNCYSDVKISSRQSISCLSSLRIQYRSSSTAKVNARRRCASLVSIITDKLALTYCQRTELKNEISGRTYPRDWEEAMDAIEVATLLFDEITRLISFIDHVSLFKSSLPLFFLWWLDMNETIEVVLRWWHILRSSIFNIVFNFSFHQCQIDRSDHLSSTSRVRQIEQRYCQGKEKTGEREKRRKQVRVRWWIFSLTLPFGKCNMWRRRETKRKKREKERRWWRRKVQNWSEKSTGSIDARFNGTGYYPIITKHSRSVTCRAEWENRPAVASVHSF